MDSFKNCEINWKAKASKLLKAELSKLQCCLNKAKNNHKKCHSQRITYKKKYREAKSILESVGIKMHRTLRGMEEDGQQYHYDFLSQQNLLGVLECSLKKLTVNQCVLSFNKLSLTKRVACIEEACLYLQLTSTSERVTQFQCYEDVYHYLQQCDQDFPLIALTDINNQMMGNNFIESKEKIHE